MSRPEVTGTHNAVATTHWLATSVAAAVLEHDGNAFDAAVAAGLTLQVVEPHLNGPGGEVPILVRVAGSGSVEVINGQGASPQAATIQHFRNLGLDLVPGSGLLAACVPGAFDAWMLLLARHGTMKLRDVMKYAITYAESGYPLVPGICAAINDVRRLFAEEWTESARIYLPSGQVPRPGDRFRNPDLAATYRRLLDEAEAASSNREGQISHARHAFYSGFVADKIDAFCGHATIMDSSGRPHSALMTGDDLARHHTTVEDPTHLDYHGYTVYKTGPWGQGPVFLQQLALLADVDLVGMGHTSARYVHTVAEYAKLAFADREAWYGDPRSVDVPVPELLSYQYNQVRRRLISDIASRELRPGSVAGHQPRLPSPVTAHPRAESTVTGVGEPTVPQLGSGPPDGDTCHLDIIDRHGNMVSATPSGGWLQSSPVIPGLGFGLGTRAQMFWLEEGLPNSLAGGKRPRTTLSPTVAMRDGTPYLAFGTPGGDGQDQWSLMFFLAHVHFGLNFPDAIDAARFSSAHFPSSFYPRTASPARLVLEDRFDTAVVRDLRRAGHDVHVVDGWSLGRVCAVGSVPGSGMLRAAADTRGRQAYAVAR